MKTNVKNGGAGRALLERNTGSWHPTGRELSYGTEAQVWGSGKILIYKIDVWQILISLVPQSHSDIDMTLCHQLGFHSLQNKKKKSHFSPFVSGLEGSCREQFGSQLSCWIHFRSCKWGSWCNTMRTFGKLVCCAQFLLVAVDKLKVNHGTVGRCSPRKSPKIIIMAF